MKQTVIGLCGRKRVGKDTIAERLVLDYGFAQTSFAAPIKAGLVAMLEDYAHVASASFESEHLKESPIPGLGDGTVTPRHLMVTLGTEWGRDLVASDLWTKALLNRLRSLSAKGHHFVVVSDVRFRNEAETLKTHGAILWHVTRPGFGGDNAHRSEQETLGDLCDAHIQNDGTVRDLAARVDNEIAMLHVTGKMPY